MERQIIWIDEDKCDGCGQCCSGCPEGALQMIDGKARLVSEITCDGLGACIGVCPQDAILVEIREAAPYDERATLNQLLPKGLNTVKAHLRHLQEHGQTTFLNQALAYLQQLNVTLPDFKEPSMESPCPGSVPQDPSKATSGPVSAPPAESHLEHWPVQLHLINPMNPVFREADLLLTADCCAFALPDFNQRYLPGKKLTIACPKLDQGQEAYLEKLRTLIDHANINTLTVMVMEVPCCSGLLRMAQQAVQLAERKVPIKAMIVGVDGSLKKQAWV